MPELPIEVHRAKGGIFGTRYKEHILAIGNTNAIPDIQTIFRTEGIHVEQ
jgi:hypothetical protein